MGEETLAVLPANPTLSQNTSNQIKVSRFETFWQISCTTQTVYVTLGNLKMSAAFRNSHHTNRFSFPRTLEGGRLMGNPLDTISGTITAGFVLTVILYGLVKMLV